MLGPPNPRSRPWHLPQHRRRRHLHPTPPPIPLLLPLPSTLLCGSVPGGASGMDATTAYDCFYNRWASSAVGGLLHRRLWGPDLAPHGRQPLIMQESRRAASPAPLSRRGCLTPRRPACSRARPDLGPHGRLPHLTHVWWPAQGTTQHSRRSSPSVSPSRKPPLPRPHPSTAHRRSLRCQGQPWPARCHACGPNLRWTVTHHYCGRLGE